MLEAIFADDLRQLDDGTIELRVSCDGILTAGAAAPLLLRLRFPREYPSHLPPEVERLEGVARDCEEYVRLSLLSLYYGQRGPAPTDIEESEVSAGVVHSWVEWLRDEWLDKAAKLASTVSVD